MGLFDFLKKKKPEEAGPEEAKPKPAEPEAPEQPASAEICSACNKPGADKHWGGMAWHKACLRKTRKMAKSMI